MAPRPRRSTKRSASSSILVGPGDRLADLGRVLRALGPEDDSLEASELADLEELLLTRAGAGLLLLDGDTVPEEDIGFVRRFLKREAHCDLVLVGLDPRTRTARRLLGLPRTRWLAWPPDLEQIQALLRSVARTATSPDGRSAPPRSRPESAAYDVGNCIEELLAGAALRGEDPPRFRYESEGELEVTLPRGPLEAGLDTIFDLAGTCAPPDADVLVQADADGDAVAITVTFPAGPLSREEPGPVDTAELDRAFGAELARPWEEALAGLLALGVDVETRIEGPTATVELSVPR